MLAQVIDRHERQIAKLLQQPMRQPPEAEDLCADHAVQSRDGSECVLRLKAGLLRNEQNHRRTERGLLQPRFHLVQDGLRLACSGTAQDKLYCHEHSSSSLLIILSPS